MALNRYRIGHEWEDRAVSCIEKLGWHVLERNYRYRHVEIDIIARDDDGYLVFIEVKYRADGAVQHPLAAVGPAKQRNICRAAVYYMKSHGFAYDVPCRFDVIAFNGDRYIHVKNAFEFAL